MHVHEQTRDANESHNMGIVQHITLKGLVKLKILHATKHKNKEAVKGT